MTRRERSDEDDRYDAMDDLTKYETEIECRLSKRHLKEGGLVLYDMTSSYFEGEKKTNGRNTDVFV